MPEKVSKKQIQQLQPAVPMPQPQQKRGFLSIFSSKTPAEVAVDSKLKELDSKQKSVKELEDSVLKRKLDLNNYEAKLMKLKEELDQERTFVMMKESQIKQTVPQFESQAKRFHDQKMALESEVIDITKKLSELRPLVALSEQKLARAKSLEQKEAQMVDWQKRIDDMKIVQDKRAGDISRKEAELVQREKTLKTQEFDALKKQKDITEDLIKLSTDKKNIEQELAGKRLDLQKIELELSQRTQSIRAQQAEIESKKKEIDSSTAALHEKENAVISQLKKFEGEKKFVEMRRGLLDRQAQKLHSIRLDLEAKERNLAEREAHIKQKELSEGRSLKSLQEQLQRIRDVDELKENLPRLKQEKQALIANISKEEESFKKQADLIEKKSRELNALERRVIERERAGNEREMKIKQREEIVSAKEKRFVDMRGELEKERRSVQELKFQTYVEKELGNIEPHEELLYAELETNTPKDFEVLTKVESARNSLNKGNNSEAQRLYMQISKDYEKMPVSDEKRKIYYEVLELKNDIELAMIKQ